MMRNRYWVLFGVAALGMAALQWWWRGEADKEEQPRRGVRSVVAKVGGRGAHGADARKRQRTGAERRAVRERLRGGGGEFDDSEHPYSSEDKETAMRLSEALDAIAGLPDGGGGAASAGSARRAALKRVLAAAAKAAASNNPSVRRHAVEACSWVGVDALATVTPLIADADAEVSEAAIDAMESALTEMEEPDVKFEVALEYMKTLAWDETALTMLETIACGAATEMLDGDTDAQLAAARRKVVESIVAFIGETRGPAQIQGMELYSDITGVKWIDAAEAMQWLSDPDGYIERSARK